MKQPNLPLIASLFIFLGSMNTGWGQGLITFNPTNGHYYQAFFGDYPWPDARNAAESQSHLGYIGHLVTIDSPGENNFVFGSVYAPNFQQYNGPAQSSWVWLGGFQPAGSDEPAGAWSWVTGEPFDYARWDTGQPSGSIGNPNGSGQNFLLMWYQGYWNDADGTGFGGGAVQGYIVEYEPVPEPSVFALFAVAVAVHVIHRRGSTSTVGSKLPTKIVSM